MKKNLMFLILVTACTATLPVFAQTPYDSFEPEQAKKEMLTMPSASFKVNNPNKEDVVGAISFDASTMTINLMDANKNAIGSIKLNPNDLKWTTMDPLAEKNYSSSPYSYCANNPIIFVDPNGMEWFYHSGDGKSDPTWIWHDGETYNTGVKDDKGKDVILQGQVAVVAFDGSKDEKLGEGQNMNGKGAVLASVTVYGPDGKNDIQHYSGFTMSSDATKFGVVADGDYTVNRLNPDDRLGPYDSDFLVESRNSRIPEQDNFNPAFPSRKPAYLTGVFIHRPNNNGWAGTFNQDGRLHGVSEGCLLISPTQWNGFHNQLQGVYSFLLQIRRK